jgi:hypothetical protein
MICLDDLAQVAEEFRKRGIDARHEYLYGPHGCIEGLNVIDDFFPLWELSLTTNLESLEKADFTAIKLRRGGDWTAEPPRSLRTARQSPC